MSTITSVPRPLAATFSKNGFTYELVLRDGDVAIYKQRLRPGVGCLAFEVVRVRVAQPGVIKDTVVPLREYAPGNEEFGTWGWSYPTLDRAKAKMRELQDAVVASAGASVSTSRER